MALRRALIGLFIAALAFPAAAQQPTGYVSAPTGALVYVGPSSPQPGLNETFSSTGSTTLSTSTTTGNVALPGAGQYVEVANGGSVTAFVALGVGSGTTATTASYAIPAGWTIFLETNRASAGISTYLAGITGSSTATLTITTGTLAPITSSGGGSNVTVTGPLGTGSAASSVRTLTVPGSVTSPAPYVYTALGCGQIAAFSASTLLSSVSGGIPAGATLASLSVETNAVRYRDDGTAPTATVGTPLAAGLSAWPYSGNLAAIRFIPQTGNATIDVCFYS